MKLYIVLRNDIDCELAREAIELDRADDGSITRAMLALIIREQWILAPGDTITIEDAS